MPSSNTVRKDQDKLIREINSTPGWTATRMGNGHWSVKNPDGERVATSGTPGLQSTLTRFREELKGIGWDPEAQARLRKTRSEAALAAEKEKNDRLMKEAVAKASARHAEEMERLKTSLPPGSKLPNGEIVDYVTKPRFFTIADALAALETADKCDCNLRPISEVNVDRLQEPMKQGEWLYMPDGLSFCTHGNIGNGKHRMKTLSEMTEAQLIEKYGEPGIWFRVTYNVPPEVLDNTDMGKGRSAADVLTQHGYKTNPKEIAGALNALMAYDHGVPWKHWSRYIVTHRQRLAALRGSYAALVAPGDKHTVMADAQRLHKSSMKMTLTSALVFCYLIQRSVPYPVWEAFLTPLLTLKGFEEGDDPRKAFYNNMLKKENRPTEARRGIRELGMAIKMWNAWATGEERTLSTFRKTESMPPVKSITRKIPALADLDTPFTT